MERGGGVVGGLGRAKKYKNGAGKASNLLLEKANWKRWRSEEKKKKKFLFSGFSARLP